MKIFVAMKCVIVYTEQGVPPAAISACKAKLAENGAAVAVRQVLSPFDLVPAVQSAKTQHGNDAYYLVLGVAVGTSSTESASAAFNLMSVRIFVSAWWQLLACCLSFHCRP